MLDTILSIVSVVTTVVFALLLFVFILVNILRGRSKGLLHTLFKIVAVFISGFLALLLAGPIGSAISGALTGALTGAIKGVFPQYDELVGTSSAIGDLITGIPAIVISMVVYLLLFVVFLALMAIPIHFGKKLINRLVPSFPKVKWAGALCGAVAGLAIFVFVCAPLAGTLSLVGDVADVVFAITDSGNESDVAQNDTSSDRMLLSGEDPVLASDLGVGTLLSNDATPSIGDNFFVNMVCILGGRPIYDHLTVIKIGDENVSVSKEISVMSDIVSSLVPVFDGSSPEKWTQEDIQGLKKATEKLADAKIVTTLMADVISDAGKKWSDNEKFFGMSMPSMGRKSVDSFFADLFEVFETTTKESVSSDLGMLADILGQLQKYGVLSSANKENMGSELGKDGFVSGLLEIIMKNDRFKNMTASAINLGVSETLDILNVPETDGEVYDRFVSQIAGAVNANGDDISALKTKVYEIFTASGIETHREITDCVAEYLASDFAGRTDVTADEVGEFFSVAFDMGVSENAKELSAYGGFEASFLSSKKYSAAEELKAVLEQMRKDNSSFEEVDWEGLATLTDRDIFRSDAITAESIRVSKDKISSMHYDDIIKECETIEDIIKDMIRFSDSVTNGKDMINSDVASLGDALNKIKGSKILGDVSGNFIKATLSSDMVQNNISISQDTLDSMVNSDDTDYENILVSVQNTANIIEGLGKTEGAISEEELDEKLEWMLGGMSESTAEIIGDVFNAENVKKFGIPDENAEKIADTVNVFFIKMAESDADTSDPEDKDVKATKTVFKFISASKNSEKDLFETVGLTVSETVHVFMDSHISRETMIEASYGENGLILDSFGVASSIDDESRQEVLLALENETRQNYANSADKQEYERAIRAIGAVFGIDVSSQFDSWTR